MPVSQEELTTHRVSLIDPLPPLMTVRNWGSQKTSAQAPSGRFLDRVQIHLGNWVSTVIRKSFVIALMLCVLAACKRNVEPGDAQYPVLNKNPQRPLDVTLIQDPTVRADLPVYWRAYNSSGGNEDKCTYSGANGGLFPGPVAYSVIDHLSFSGNSDRLQSRFFFDMYEPGLCGYGFYAWFYRADPGADSILLHLVEYKDDDSLPAEASVDLWCYPTTGSAGDYCDSLSAASSQNVNRAEQYRISGLPTPEQASVAKANGDRQPPALVGPNTRSLVIRVHDARINKT